MPAPIVTCSKCGEEKPVHLSILANGVSRHFCADCVEPTDFDHLPPGLRGLLHAGNAMRAAFDPAALHDWRQN